MKTVMILAVTSIFIVSAHGQGFENLNFESAQNLPANPGLSGTYVSVASALPGWTIFAANTVLSSIYYVSNSFPESVAQVELEGGPPALGGNLSVGLFSIGASISQTGLIPANAESLLFEASFPLSLEVTLGGQNLPYSALSGGPNYTVYQANIPPSMDGQMETLTFGLDGPGGGTLIDDIEFSPQAVPEPSECALIGFGALLFGLCSLRKQHI